MIGIDDIVQVTGRVHYVVNHGNEKHPNWFVGIVFDDRPVPVEIPMTAAHKGIVIEPGIEFVCACGNKILEVTENK